jgi:maltose O-acetyltransferase
MSLYRRLINKIRGNMDVDSLVQKGLIVGENVFINFGCVIDESFCWLIELGNNVTLAPHVHILAHDASTKRELGYTKLGGGKNRKQCIYWCRDNYSSRNKYRR